MDQNEILQNNTYEGTNNELAAILESVLHIQLLTRNTREHIGFYEVTPRLGEKTKWRERAMMLGAALELAITDLLDSSSQMQLSEPLAQTLGNIERLVIDFSEKLSNSQSNGELLGLRVLADQLEISSQNLGSITNRLREKATQ